MKIVSAVLAFSMAVAGLSALTLSEKEAVMWALEANPDIMVSRLDRHSDSLNSDIAAAGWMPELGVSAQTEYKPLSSGTLAPDPALKNSAELSLGQVLPGGGKASVSVGQSVKNTLDSSNHSYGTALSLSYRQPLLKGAWSNADQDYKVKLARINNETVTLQFKKAVLAELSAVRTRYWDYYEQKQLLRIAEDAYAFAEKRHQSELARFGLGQTAELDTLNAAVELLQARKALLNAGNSVRRARKELGVRLMLAGDAVEITEGPDVTVGEIPPADEFLTLAGTYDPQLKIFELTRTRLEYEYRNVKNTLLPQLDAVASYSYGVGSDRIFADEGISKNALLKLVFGYSVPVRELRLTAEQKRLSQKSNDIKQKQYRFQLKNRVTDLVETWELERTGLDIMRKTAEAASRQLDAAQAGYEMGRVSRLELLEAENTRTKAAADYVRARVTMKRLEIIFDEITGKLFDTFGVTL